MSKQTEKMRKRSRGILVSVKYRRILEGIAVGIVAGLLVSAFRLALTKADEVREMLLEGSRKNPLTGLLALTILAVFALALTLIVKKEPLCSGSGIPQVKGELLGRVKSNWLRVIAAKFFGGIMAIGGGLSLGREGPSIQLGAMAGKGFSRLSGRLRTEEQLLMTCGAGAGLAAAFGAPLAGVVFAIEELHQKFSTGILICTMASAVTGDWMASYIFGLKPVFVLTISGGLPLSRYWLALVLGLALGILGVIYNRLIAFFQNFFDMVKPGWLKVAIPLAAVILLAIVYPAVLGGGHELVALSAEGLGVKALGILLVVKLIFSTFSFGTKAPGGIFLPLLVLGAVSGGLFTSVMSPLLGYGNMYGAYFVVLGMAGMFSAIVRAPITGIILISEMTGIFSNLLPISIVSLAAYLTAEILGGKPIYEQLLGRLLKNGTVK